MDLNKEFKFCETKKNRGRGGLFWGQIRVDVNGGGGGGSGWVGSGVRVDVNEEVNFGGGGGVGRSQGD